LEELPEIRHHRVVCPPLELKPILMIVSSNCIRCQFGPYSSP
jgi:hypothetical protein